ncbi:halogenase [Luteitalea sp. TBR-22]|uniref:NAD(P)/FAD-dependent oxidoreductase n=1 Tax=Luteitalea sp. TBR-22 TaxID=2802971 RepID=UPI001AF69E00|nr:NAD(P)/FAD-dependent oxidoreductase [Luteitalea sp. TBR-22]BCS35276.1 halogenase [Luteitalea sp. TBR-22]
MSLTTYDVIIAGGGLAGLCLARQLRQEHPDITILVAEKKKHPVPEAAHKVGESSVEIGAHYFSKILGLEPHLLEKQLYKLGLRYFFTEGDNRDVTQRIELGPKTFPKVPSFQLDRGRLENFLLEEDRKAGIEVLDGVKVKAIEFGDPHHRVDIEIDGKIQSFKGRWVVDGSGRAGLIRRKLGLTRTASHNANAVWFRMGSRIKIDDWSPKASWKDWMPTEERWMSTVHLMGKGYWTWLIPLASESHSIGIVADDAIHPYQTLNRFDKAMAWLHKFEPQCAEYLEDHRSELDDFLGLQHFSHNCTQMYSADRWALIGEAGVFTDPFYSPGSDFISIGNDITAELIARDRRGEDITHHAAFFSRMYLLLFQAFLKLYDGQYPIMGNAQVMTVKVAWDNACYWAISALLYFRRKYRDMAYMQQLEGLLTRFFFLHARMQARLKAWSDSDQASYGYQQMSLLDMPYLHRIQGQLWDDIDDATLTMRLTENFAELERYADVILQMAAGKTIARDHGGFENAAVFQLPKAHVAA